MQVGDLVMYRDKADGSFCFPLLGLFGVAPSKRPALALELSSTSCDTLNEPEGGWRRSPLTLCGAEGGHPLSRVSPLLLKDGFRQDLEEEGFLQAVPSQATPSR